MDRGQKGSATAEYLSVVTLFTAAIIALGGFGVPQAVASAIAGAVETAICRIGANDSCGSTASDEAASPDVSLDERVAHLEDSAARRRDELLIETPDAAGSRFAELHFAVLEALEAGRIDEAEQLDALLEMYVRLSRGEHLQGSDRGGLVEDLWMSGNKWRRAVARGTIYLGPDGDNFRYLDIPASPGDGLIVLDFFIPFETSGPPPVELKGDDRTFHPDGPLSSELPLNKSRILIILDRETGRAAIYQSHTCNVFYGQCREARPIALDLDDRTQFVPELSNDVTGPYIAPTNRFEIDADGDSIRLTYDALNSLTWPVFAVEGTVELTRTPEGTYAITHDRRDHYPAIGIYQYRPGQEPWIIEERPSEEALEGASDMEWLPPWWPWGATTMTIRRRRCGREVALAVFGLVAFLAVSCGDTPPERATGERLSPPPASASPSPRLAGSKDPGSFPKRPDASFDLAESARGWQLLDRAKWMRGRGVLMTVGPRLEVVRAVSPIRVHPGSPVMIEAEVVLPNSKGSGAGVWCRADRAFKSGYAFVIGRDGGWGLFRYDDGVPTQLERGAVYPGELRGREPTLIRLACGATTDRGMVFAIAFNDKPFALIAEHARPLSRRIGRVGVTASRVPAGGQPARALLTHFSARLGSGE